MRSALQSEGSPEDRLFVYGTLQVPVVMKALIARVPEGVKATLPGYARYRLAGHVFPGILMEATECVEGILYSGMTKAELEVIDAFEDGMYTRRRVEVHAARGGTVAALTYTLRDDAAGLARRNDPWSLERFLAEFGIRYVEGCVAFRTAFDEQGERSSPSGPTSASL